MNLVTLSPEDPNPRRSFYDLRQNASPHDCSILVEWFRDIHLTLNAEICHLLLSGYKYEATFAKMGDALLWEEDSFYSDSFKIA